MSFFKLSLFIGWLCFSGCTSNVTIPAKGEGNPFPKPNTPFQKISIFMALVSYQGEAPPFNLSYAGVLAELTKQKIEKSCFGFCEVDIAILPIIEMPQPEDYYLADPFVRIQKDVVTIIENTLGPITDDVYLSIFSKKLWPAAANGQGSINLRSTMIPFGGEDLWVHELGHAFGFPHEDAIIGNWFSSLPTFQRYGNVFAFMGAGGGCATAKQDPLEFMPWNKLLLGWIPEENFIDASSVNSAFLLPIDDPAIAQKGNVAALRIRESADRDIYVFRRDDRLFVTSNTNVEYVGPGNRTAPIVSTALTTRHNLLFDFSPLSQSEPCADMTDAHLPVGQSFTINEVVITNMGLTGSLLEVQISAGASALGYDEQRAPNIFLKTAENPKLLIDGPIEFVVTHLPRSSGEGVPSVKFELFPNTDELIAWIGGSGPKPTPFATSNGVASGNEFRWSVDPTLYPQGRQRLVVTATNANGSSVRVHDILADYQ